MEQVNPPSVKIYDILKSFWKGARLYKGSLFLLLLTVAIVNVIEIIVPLYYKRFFDLIANTSDPELTAPVLTSIILSIFALHGIFWLLHRVAAYNDINFITKTSATLKTQSFEYLLGHSHSFFSNNFTGSLVQKVNRFARAFDRLADRIIWNLIPILIRMVGVGIILWLVQPIIAYIILGWAIFFLLFNYIFSRWKLKYDIRVAEADSRTTAVLADTVTNHNNVELFSKKKAESANFKNTAEIQAKTHATALHLGTIAEAIQGALILSIEFFIFYFSIQFWKEGDITIGFFVLIQAYILALAYRLWDFGRVVRDIYESYADAKEMVEIMKTPHGIRDIPNAKDIKVSAGEVVFDNVLFSFNATRQVLHDLNLNIKPGEKVALVGHSGAGKSTIVKLLLRLHEPTSGHIIIDGQDIQKVSQDSLRENIALVPQDPVLFHRTIRENIRYGNPKASDMDVEEAAKLAHCDEFIRELSHGYDTFVGERGIKLSGGERQRIAIARAILKNPPILVLDEATSSLDSHSELLIQDALDKLMEGKTVIAIAHRLSTIRKMNRIIVLEDGRVVEDGTHNELIENTSSVYGNLWSLQAGGFLKDNDSEEEDKDEQKE